MPTRCVPSAQSKLLHSTQNRLLIGVQLPTMYSPWMQLEVQFLHAVDPVSGWYLPLSQSWHAGVPCSGATLPGRHARHSVALLRPGTGLAVPGEQRSHVSSELLPGCSLKRPAGQLCQPPPHVSTAAQKPPVAQRSQVVSPVDAWNSPAGHASQDTAPGSADFLPEGHAEHSPTVPLKLA